MLIAAGCTDGGPHPEPPRFGAMDDAGAGGAGDAGAEGPDRAGSGGSGAAAGVGVPSAGAGGGPTASGAGASGAGGAAADPDCPGDEDAGVCDEDAGALR